MEEKEALTGLGIVHKGLLADLVPSLNEPGQSPARRELLYGRPRGDVRDTRLVSAVPSRVLQLLI